jgi:hypothetical protein
LHVLDRLPKTLQKMPQQTPSSNLHSLSITSITL